MCYIIGHLGVLYSLQWKLQQVYRSIPEGLQLSTDVEHARDAQPHSWPNLCRSITASACGVNGRVTLVVVWDPPGSCPATDIHDLGQSVQLRRQRIKSIRAHL